jgi:hypothetical protein
MVVGAPLFVLWWLDGLKRSDAEVEYQSHQLRDEVRRAVQAELSGKKPLAKMVDAEVEDGDQALERRR